jgi:hypothetical protein
LGYGLGRKLPDRLRNEANGFTEQLAKSCGNGSQAVCRVWCAIRTPKVTQDDDARVCRKEMTNRWNRRTNATVVSDDSVFERNIKVAPNYDARSIEVPEGREGT